MKVCNTVFTGEIDFLKFIEINKIPNSDKVLLQVFTGVLDQEYIVHLIGFIKETLPLINIIGSSTDGEIIGEQVLEESTVLSFAVFEQTQIKLYYESKKRSDYQMGKSLIYQIEDIENAKAAITFTDGLSTNGEVFLKAFHKYASKLQVAGGLSGDNAKFTKTYLIINEKVYSSGAVAAVLYNPNLIVNTAFSFGWEKIGKAMTVTKAVENIVYSIDNMTPMQVYQKYLGKEIGDSLPSTGIEFPLILDRDGSKIARAVIGKNSDDSLVFAGNIKKGDKVYLGYGNIDNILMSRFDLYDHISSIPFEAIFIYSCMARKRLLGDDIKNEIAPLARVAPAAGFFTYGEFYYSNSKYNSSKNHLFNETMTTLTLSETSQSKITIDDQTKQSLVNNIHTIRALSHLISVTSKELNELNVTLEDEIQDQVKKMKTQEQLLLEQSKNAAMGEMIGNIAHQWRQPLSTISAGATGIKLQKKINTLTDEQLVKTCDIINDNAQFLSKTIDDFRNFIKGDRDYVSFNLKDTVGNFLNLVHPSFKRHSLEVILDIDNSIELYGHPNELIQCFMNLFNNAKDALKDSPHPEKYIFIELMKEDGNAVIKFRDNAGGIPEDILPRIFEPYFTTKHQSVGTGLGLHMTYNLITKGMNGTITALNMNYNYNGNFYNGAEFVIILPITSK
jgi:c-di-GMP phosphodiesterase